MSLLGLYFFFHMFLVLVNHDLFVCVVRGYCSSFVVKGSSWFFNIPFDCVCNFVHIYCTLWRSNWSCLLHKHLFFFGGHELVRHKGEASVMQGVSVSFVNLFLA